MQHFDLSAGSSYSQKLPHNYYHLDLYNITFPLHLDSSWCTPLNKIGKETSSFGKHNKNSPDCYPLLNLDLT